MRNNNIMNLRITTTLALLFIAQIILFSQNRNLTMLSNVGYPEICNDIWGYVDQDEIEYAILGTTLATAILSLEDPENPIERAYIPGATSTWIIFRSMAEWLKHRD